jgi:DmsE family decaheme c-type cytochrome
VEQEFLLSYHHPVVQARMGCLSCHGPHGEEGSLEASSDETELCTSCHVEVAGPWIYEHDALFDGCTSCHAPHGSPNPKMLVMTGNALCLQCHVEAAYPDVGGAGHAAYLGSGATCWQCHFEVHGSNTSQMLAPGM